ncbi:MAG: tRNA/rRNA methyltransferase (SpoU) [Acidimicrobiales bacterium]|nr:tRNA/rRNA methyltransferase (SpoU) [Acidimicrobiales bacterium]
MATAYRAPVPVRAVAFDLGDADLRDPEAGDVIEELTHRYVLGLVTNGDIDPGRSGVARAFAFRLAADDVGIRRPDPRLYAMAAAAAGCHPSELVSVGDQPDEDVAAAQAAGCRGVWLDRTAAACPPGIEPDATIADLTELPAVLARFDAEEHAAAGSVGTGPHAEPWPDDTRLDPDLLAAGDRRNVVDRYRYWSEEAIVADLDERRHRFHVAVENWRSDHNIGAVVRNANAFGAAAVHIVGRRRWNRRGAMATDRYLHLHQHDTVAALVAWAAGEGLPIVGVDNIDGSVPLELTELPDGCVLLFGQEGPGLSPEAVAACDRVCSIAQFGSTRSVNAGVASGIAMHAWIRSHAELQSGPDIEVEVEAER